MYELPKLSYEYGVLEPHIDARTMEVHYTKHHAGYVSKLNDALSKYPEFEKKTLEEILKNLKSIPGNIQKSVRNNGGGHFNHSLFWKILSPQGGTLREGNLLKSISESFGNFESFKELFSKSAADIFGSGWAWLIEASDKKLKISVTSNQDNPLMTEEGRPLLGLDVWEHAYYLHYQNRRADYISAWWNVINWEEVENIYKGNNK